jgi:hypothetical protein
MCCRGVVDTDMMLGNVNGFLHRKGLLDDYDIISPCCNVNHLGFKSFGPFMLYRNVPRITELFRQMESLYDSLSNQTVMMIDEWGGFAPDGGLHGPYYDRSMTKLILDKKDALHIRVVGEFVNVPHGTDIPCHIPDQLVSANSSVSTREHRKERTALPCGLCRWSLGTRKTGSRLEAQSAPYKLRQMVYCHYQYGKDVTARNLRGMSQDEMAALLAAPAIERTFSDGFRAVSTAAPALMSATTSQHVLRRSESVALVNQRAIQESKTKPESERDNGVTATATLALPVRHRARVVLITTVFGKCPLYVPIFLKTAAFSGVDVLMVGDTKLVTFPQLPPNVRQIHMTWETLVGLVSNRVFDGRQLPQLLKANRYKVIDLKPAYGVLFREHITAYEFW